VSQKKLGILLAINGTDFGGTESALAEIAVKLDARGHRVHVLSIKEPGRTGARLRERGIDVDTLGMDDVVNPLNMVTATRRFVRWLEEHEIDVVQSFLPRANVVSRVANRLARGSRPHLSSERSTDFNRSRLICRLNGWTARLTDRVLAVSADLRELLVERDRLPAEKIRILQNGIDVGRVDAAPRSDVHKELGLTCDDVLFCTVGRLIPDKGYVYLAEALAQMQQPAHVVLVGEGDEEARIRRAVSQWGVEDRFHLIGFRPDVLGIMKDVDAFVLTSLEEGIPVVLVEAMAVGLPIVSTRVGGIAGLVKEDETALLVPPAEIWAGQVEERSSESAHAEGVTRLANAMDRLAADADLRRSFGAAGRTRVAERFALDQIIDQLEAHYHELLGQ
jgi:glycosyltransferase involved in cell wall biosynthesis